MKVALFHNAPSGGAKRAILEWTRRLSCRHHVDVYTLSTADHEFCDVRPYVHGHMVGEFDPKPLFRTPFGRLNQLQRWRDLRALTRLGRVMAREIDHSRCDVAFVHTCSFSATPTVLQFIDSPVVYYLHEPVGGAHGADPLDQSALPTWRQRLDRWDPAIALYRARLADIQRTGIHRATRLVVNSDFTRRQVKNRFGIDAAVCPCGVDADLFRPLPDVSREHRVLSVGELTPRKAFGFVVESIGQLPEAARPALVLACNRVDPAERLRVETLAAQRGVTLTVLTHLSPEALVVEYNRAAVCAYAPINEPLGLVALEAMACGTPVVGVREGGVAETVRHEQTGLLVTRDSAQFATALQRLLKNWPLASRYGQNGRDHVAAYWSWERSVAAIEEHLYACADAH